MFIIDSENGDVRVEKVQYDTDFMDKVFERRKKRELDIQHSDDGEKVSFFNYVKEKESSVGKCKATGSQKENEVIKNRRKRNVFSTNRKRFNSDYAREKRMAEEKLLELQHQYLRCNREAGPNAPDQCKDIYFRFMKFTKEINEKFHQFANDNFEDVIKMENDSKKNKRTQSDRINEIKSSKQVEQTAYLTKNNENVGKTYFGDGFYSYSYDQIPKIHEDLNENFDNFNNKRNREQIGPIPFQTQQRPETTVNTEQQVKNIPVKVPEPTGEIKIMLRN